MWIKILKYAAKAAVYFGLHEKAGDWIKDKVSNKIDKTVDKLDGESASEQEIHDIIDGE